MRILVCGDRNWSKPWVIHTFLDGLLVYFENEPVVVIEGCARGADRAACEWGQPIEQVEHLHFPAQWDKYGRAAGPIRNRQQFDEGEPDVVFAFHDNLSESKGTKDMVEYAHSKGTPVYVIGRYDG